MFYAGIDWSTTFNDLAIVDEAGRVVARERVEATPEGVRTLLRALSTTVATNHRLGRRDITVGIESSRGLLVQALLDAGQPVAAINPSVVAHYRGRRHVAVRKSDPADAELIANIIRTDGQHHRLLHRDSPQASVLTVLTRTQQRLIQARNASHFRLRADLREYYPAALVAWSGLPGDVTRAEARAVLAVAPTPTAAARLTRRHLAATLERAGRTRLIQDHADRLFTLFRQPALRQHPDVEEAMGLRMLASLGVINKTIFLLNQFTEQVSDAFHDHPLSKIYLSFPGVGPIIGARLLAELGDDLSRFASSRHLRAFCGAAPITLQSGNVKHIHHRRIASASLKSTGYLWSFTALQAPECRAYYDQRRQEHHEAYRAALRRLYGRLLCCLYHCLAHEELYNPERAFPPRQASAAVSG